MNCDEIEELLSDLLDDELAEGDRTAVQAHVDACERCTATYRALKRTVRFVRANANPELLPGTPGGVYQEFTRALVDETLGKSGEQVFVEAIAKLPHNEGERP